MEGVAGVSAVADLARLRGEVARPRPVSELYRDLGQVLEP
jgi:hypothetical protein